MVSSIISMERETTSERRLKRANQWKLTAVVLLALISPVFTDVMFVDRQGAVIRGVIVGTIEQDVPVFQACQQLV
jgi:hypothetical protein